MSKYVIIDEHGEIFLDTLDQKIKSIETCKEVLNNLKLNEDNTLTTTIEHETYLVESFDFPLLVRNINHDSGKIFLHTDYDLYFEAHPLKWSVNENDDFLGLTTTNIPFKLSKKAQIHLFSLCEKYDDDFFRIQNHTFKTPPYYKTNSDIKSAFFWNDIYKTEPHPGWDLKNPAEAFKDMLQRLKLPKSRILVLGCGFGHDAAFFAEVGHVVTAVDFSSEAITEAKKKYGHIHNLTFECMDVFNLPQDWNFSFDIIIEHTLFCAIKPENRKNLIAVWKRLLHEEGQILAIFFTMFKQTGPPFGATEFELRSMLMPYFQFLFWGRLRNSVSHRLGKELFVMGKKR